MTLKKIETTREFTSWFERARVGQTVVYCVGYLPLDREEHDPHTKHLTADAKIIDALAKAVLECAEVEKLHLTQKRISAHLYEYRATKTTPKSVAYLARIAVAK